MTKPGESVEGITMPRGNPGALLSAGKQLQGIGMQLDATSSRVAAMPSLLSNWAGPGSSVFADLTGQQSTSISSSGTQVLMSGLNISSYADMLEDAQQKAQRAITKAKHAREEINDAKEDIRQALADQTDAQNRMDLANIARQAAEMRLLSSAIDSLLGDGGAQAAIDAANTAHANAEKDLHEAERREKRARVKLKHATDDLHDARTDGHDAAQTAEDVGILLQTVLRQMPDGVLGMPGAPAEGQIAAAGNVPKNQPLHVPINQMEPPDDWPAWKKEWFKIGRGEMTVLAGTLGLAKKAYDDPEKVPGGFAALGSRTYHDPIGTGKSLVGYDELASGRYSDWLGQMGIGLLAGGAGTVPARGSRLTRVAGRPAITPVGRSAPINSGKFAGSRMDFRKPDFNTRRGTVPPGISAAERERLAAKYPEGVRYTRAGYPVLTPHRIDHVDVPGLNGNRGHDENLANQMTRRAETPEGYVWHHVENGRTMELVPRDLHNAARHTGGASAIQNGQAGLVSPGGVFTPFEGAAAGGGAAVGGTVGGPAAAQSP